MAEDKEARCLTALPTLLPSCFFDNASHQPAAKAERSDAFVGRLDVIVM